MPLTAVFLLFGSAVLHTSWNLLLKQAGEKYVVTWWAVLLGSAAFLPIMFFTGLPSRAIWLLLGISVIVEVGYYILLPFAYRISDFSLVYPIARGAAPALIATWSFLFLGEKLSLPGLIGLVVIIVGLLLVATGKLSGFSGGAFPTRSVFVALALALLISMYSTIDGAAVRQTQAFPYAVSIFFLVPVVTTPLMLRVYGWETLRIGLVGGWARILGIGLLMVSAYLLALIAYSIASVSYVGAIRETSVVMAALVGWLYLGEEMGVRRLIGSIVIFLGILLIAFWG